MRNITHLEIHCIPFSHTVFDVVDRLFRIAREYFKVLNAIASEVWPARVNLATKLDYYRLYRVMERWNDHISPKIATCEMTEDSIKANH